MAKLSDMLNVPVHSPADSAKVQRHDPDRAPGSAKRDTEPLRQAPETDRLDPRQERKPLATVRYGD